MALDLSTYNGFAQATLSGASNALNLLTGLNTDKWNIQEGSYSHPDLPGHNPPVLFHIFKTNADYSGAVDNIQKSTRF
jgi:hypothetical protein